MPHDHRTVSWGKRRRCDDDGRGEEQARGGSSAGSDRGRRRHRRWHGLSQGDGGQRGREGPCGAARAVGVRRAFGREQSPDSDGRVGGERGAGGVAAQRRLRRDARHEWTGHQRRSGDRRARSPDGGGRHAATVSARRPERCPRRRSGHRSSRSEARTLTLLNTLTHQILSAHLVGGRLVAGEEIQLRVDQALLQDATGTMACLQLEYLGPRAPREAATAAPDGAATRPALEQFEALGVERIGIPFAIVYVDHNILAVDFKNPDDHRFLRTFCARYGLHYSRPGNGICHYLHIERFARPGQVLVGADSHTTTSGALGMLAIGAGGLEVACALAGYPFALQAPRVVGVRLEGRLRPWVQAKDVILELLRRHGVRGGRGCVFEFYGSGVATLDVTERATICNMTVETGATTGIFPSDARTREWLTSQARGEQWVERTTGDTDDYDDVEVIELDRLEPLIARPGSPGDVVPVREVAGLEAQQVCVGSSVNS